ncbi:MAG: 2-hydroxy-3-oxopropionate reductase [Ramlibacter sp.]|nr:2-hydroxy-3-oxopropionate reductase [Ramlibacter sp.]
MNIAFCGLGLMGSAMVRRLLAAGHSVRVWNRSAAKADALVALGASRFDTPGQAAQGADAVLTCLYDADSVEAVVFGPDGIASATGLRWLADHSSISPAATRAFAQRLHELCGADWIDAPVSGGIGGAEAGTLAIMAGGPERHWEEVVAVLSAYGGNVTHMGAAGSGQATKLCNQTIVAATVAAVAEAVAFAARNGIALDKLAPALAGGWADSKPLQVFLPRMLQAQAQSIGALSTMLKDVDTVLANAAASGVTMTVTASVQQLLRRAQDQGLGEAELSAVVSVPWPERRDSFLGQLAQLREART